MPPALPKPLATYYNTLATFQHQGAHNEGATRTAFQRLLDDMGRPHGLVVLGEQSIEGTRKRRIQVDGLIRDPYRFTRGIWEAKDTADDLDTEINKKIASGYPLKNTIFEDTRRAVLYQNGSVVFNHPITDPDQLQRLLDTFFSYSEPQIEEFHKAVAEFRERIPELARGLTEIIDEAKRDNRAFRDALDSFLTLCREALNPATTPEEVEDMLKQHILTERIFRSIFDNPDFVRRNSVAVELERMVAALTSRSFSRDTFLSRLDFFYKAIEASARTITDYSEKQSLLNTLYEQFFQAYSTRAADVHGIVYTPHEIVHWMVSSVERALQAEFDLSLSSPGVHIIDPCVGTGTFIMEILQRITSTPALTQKYATDLHANEINLLPYYIAAQNIEHAYYEHTGTYAPFEGLVFADTLNMETLQQSMFSPANTERIVRQNQAPIRVIIGNPPYNVGQVNENDNNKNRRHPRVDSRIRETYGAASRATLQTKLYDMYVKFFRWATDRLGNRDGIICFVSNNSFMEQLAFDGMRKHLLQDFTRIYTFDLGGNVRKNPKLSGTKNNVFGIQVGVTITMMIRNSEHTAHELYYARLDEFWSKEQKLHHLTEVQDATQVNWRLLISDARNNWLTEGMNANFDMLMPIGSKEAREVSALDTTTIFKTYSIGVNTARDQWAYDFDASRLGERAMAFIDAYNGQVLRWIRRNNPTATVDDFVSYDDKRIKWSESLKLNLSRAKYFDFSTDAIRQALYRPFAKRYLYFAEGFIDRPSTVAHVFPTLAQEQENYAICATNPGSEKPFMVVLSKLIPDLHLVGPGAGTLCFPFYTYNPDGTNRRENITDWALTQFQTHYNDPTITKRDIFHYVYAVLHSPEYRTKYAANLKRDLPRIPFVPPAAFRPYAEEGATLATLHRDYESAPQHPLQHLENPDHPYTLRVESMKLSPDRASIRYNPSLTIAGIPPETYNYRLGNRSALEWVIDQYRVSTDPRSNIHTDPNNPDDPSYILRLIAQVVHISLQTQSIVNSLPPIS
ncbi:MAG: type ISP restriction/modification enzyme [Chloroflexia bacterium]